MTRATCPHPALARTRRWAWVALAFLCLSAFWPGLAGAPRPLAAQARDDEASPTTLLYPGILSTNFYHTCALTPPGAADCWGSNNYGQAADQPGPYTQLAVGHTHTCGLTPTGAADCWGTSNYGQAADQPGPYTQLVAGLFHTCGLTQGGAADCWGYNDYGQAADQTGPYTQLRAGYYHTCGLTPAGAADCWGYNSNGQANDQPGPYVQIAVGYLHSCGLTPAGAADCWGDVTYGQAYDQPGPYTHLTTGLFHTCALTPAGVARCWGHNGYGQSYNQTGPFSQLAAGYWHTCGLTLAGAVSCWGYNGYGQATGQPGTYGPYVGNTAASAMPDGYLTAENTPLSAPAPGVLGNDVDPDGDPLTASLGSAPAHGLLILNSDGSFNYTPDADYHGFDSFTYRAFDGLVDSNLATVHIAIGPQPDPEPGVLTAGGYHSCALTPTGEADCWGDNGYGQATDQAGPYSQLRAGQYHTCGLTDEGAADCWGLDASGQATDQAGPFTQLVAGHYHSCGLTPAGAADCWGDNSYGQAADQPGPYTQLRAGEYHTCGLRPTGFADCWGQNFAGQAVDQPGPFVQIAAGGVHTCGLMAGGAADCWGDSSYGQASDQVGPFGQLSAGYLHTCGLTGSGSADCWGWNVHGQATDQPGPYSLLTAGAQHSCGLTESGSADCWGWNAYGQANDQPGPYGAYGLPVARDDSYSVAEDTALLTPAPGVLANDSDANHDPLTALLVSAPMHGALTLRDDGSFDYMPAANYHGPDSFTYRASDGQASSYVATVYLTVTPINDAPEALDNSYNTAEDSELVVAAPGILDNDTDEEGDGLTAVLVDATTHGALTLNSDGSLNYIPAANYFGPDSFTYQAYDGATYSTIASVNLTVDPVNDAPIAHDDDYAALEDTPLAIAAPGILGNDVDVENDLLSALLVSPPTHGVVMVHALGSFDYTPHANYHGPDSFTYLASDGVANSNSAVVNLTIGPINDSPTAFDDNYTSPTNTPLAVAAPGVLSNDTDVDGDSLTAALVGAPMHGALTLNSDGSFNYTPDVDYYGMDGFTYQAHDGSSASNVAAVTLTVTLSLITDQGILAAGLYHTCGLTPTGQADCWGANNYGQATDQPGPYVQLSVGYYHSCGLMPTGAVDCWGRNNYGQAVDQPGPYTQISAGAWHSCGLRADGSADCWGRNEDGQANDQPGPYSQISAGAWHSCGLTAAGAIDCWGRNNFGQATDQPGPYDQLRAGYLHTCGLTPAQAIDCWGDDSYGQAADQPGPFIHLNVGGYHSCGLTFDHAADCWGWNDYGQAATQSGPYGQLVAGYAHTCGLLSDGSADCWGYNDFGQAADQPGPYGAYLPNTAPVAQDGSYSLLEDAVLNVFAPGVLDNDSDADNDTLTAVLVDTPAHGVVTFHNDGSFSYTPQADFNGTDSFTYRASDGLAYSNIAAVNLTIDPLNDAPLAYDDNYSTAEDTRLSVPAPGVQSNDIDWENDRLTVMLVSLPTHGIVFSHPDGSFKYQPDENYNGPDSFTYRVSDGLASSNAATVNLTVLPVNDPPTAQADAYSVAANTPLFVAAPGILLNDFDPDGDWLRLKLVANASHGVVKLYADGSLRYRPGPDFVGEDSFVYQLSDGEWRVTATVTLVVGGLNLLE